MIDVAGLIIKPLNLYLNKEYEIELCFSYIDLKAVFIESFRRTFLYIASERKFLKSDSNWVNFLNDALVSYNKNKRSPINMKPVDSSNNPEKLTYKNFTYKKFTSTSSKTKPALKVGNYVKIAAKGNGFCKGFTYN